MTPAEAAAAHGTKLQVSKLNYAQRGFVFSYHGIADLKVVESSVFTPERAEQGLSVNREQYANAVGKAAAGRDSEQAVGFSLCIRGITA